MLPTQTTQANQIDRLAQEMIKLPQVELPTDHFFADGMYARAVFRPAGAVIVGRVHKREHFYIILSGCVDVTTVDGTLERHIAPKIIVSKPGTQRAVHAVTDSLCMTVHRTDKTELEDIEEELVEPSPYNAFDAFNKLTNDGKRLGVTQ
jgi:hypothetical protein